MMNYFLLLLINAFVSLFTAWGITELQWSIVWCDIGGKSRKLRKVKKEYGPPWKILRTGQPPLRHAKQLKFWCFFLLAYILFEVVLHIIVGAVYFIFKADSAVYYWFSMFAIMQNLVVCLFLRFQSDANRQTKYDRIRRAKKAKNKKW